MYRNINLSHRIWFLPAQPAHNSEASIVKSPQGFADTSWRPRPCWAWANGRERTTVWTLSTWDSVTRCAVHPVIFSPWEKWWEATCRDRDWKPVWLPVLLLGFLDVVSQDRKTESRHQFLFSSSENMRTCIIAPQKTQTLEHEKVSPEWKLCSCGNYLWWLNLLACVTAHSGVCTHNNGTQQMPW